MDTNKVEASTAFGMYEKSSNVFFIRREGGLQSYEK